MSTEPATMQILKATIYARKRLTLMGLVLLFSIGVYGQAPVASFICSTTSGCAPLNVQFTSTSTNAVSYTWNFGNGNTSTLANPSNVFLSVGSYNVTLTATSSSGQSNIFSKTIVVRSEEHTSEL